MADERVIERFDARLVDDVCGNKDVVMRSRHDGLFVRFEDHAQVVADLQAKLEEQEQQFTEHTKAVGRFLSDMYATMIDPLDDGDDRKVSEMCELLLHAASDNRQALQDQMDRAGNLPANWKEDSSLETWFPLTAAELQRLRDENSELERKGKELCSVYGNSLIKIHDLEHDNAALRGVVPKKSKINPLRNVTTYQVSPPHPARRKQMSVNNFDVLKRMAAENKSIQLCTTITQLNFSAKKGGTEVSVGVPGNICFDLDSGKTTAFLLLYNVREFNELKAAMEAEATPEAGESE